MGVVEETAKRIARIAETDIDQAREEWAAIVAQAQRANVENHDFKKALAFNAHLATALRELRVPIWGDREAFGDEEEGRVPA